MKSRLFVFGDSWSLDYFKEPYLNSKEIKRYSKFYNEFGHWTNHMEKFFQVQNFSEGASSIENIIYQLGNLPDFEDGDRIIIIFGSPVDLFGLRMEKILDILWVKKIVFYIH